MSQSPTLHQYVDARFHTTFGKPHTSMGKDDHWRLQASPLQWPIDVLLNGTRDIPVLWIFDASAAEVGVFSASITREDQVDELIQSIQARVRNAAPSRAS